jgi:hypothetical protein
VTPEAICTYREPVDVADRLGEDDLRGQRVLDQAGVDLMKPFRPKFTDR